MNMRTKPTPKGLLFNFLALIFFGSVFGQDIEKDLPEFSEIKTFNGVEVQLIPAEENRISITGHSKEKVKFEIKEDRLEIKRTLDNIWSEDNTLIKVFFTSVERLDATQNSIIQFFEPLEGPDLVFRAQEGSLIFGKVEAGKISSKSTTGAKIQLQGNATEQLVEINTGGHFLGKDLETDKTTVSVNMGGLAEVFAQDYCKATTQLGGNIHVYGDPEVLDQKTSLGGGISKMN